MLRPYAGISFNYDSNVFGLPDTDASRALLGGGELSDTSRTMRVGLDIDKIYSRQQFIARAELNKTTFDEYSILDYEGRSLSGDWLWQLGNRFNGRLGYSYSRGLTPYTDFHAIEQNIRIQKSANFSANWRFHPSWRVRTSLSENSLSYESISQRRGNRDESHVEVGADYLASSGSTFGVQARQTRGRFPYPTVLPSGDSIDGYQQDEVKANIDWRASGKTRLQLVGGQVRRKNNAESAREFDGFNLRLTGTWLATAKLSFSSAIWREIGVLDTASAIYSINDGLSASAKWKISEKLSAEGQWVREKRDYSESSIFAGTRLAGLDDTVRRISLSLVYAPWQRVTTQIGLFRNAQSASIFQQGYERNGAAASIEYHF